VCIQPARWRFNQQILGAQPVKIVVFFNKHNWGFRRRWVALSKRYKPCESFFPHWFPHKNAGTRRRENFFATFMATYGFPMVSCRFALGSPNHPNHLLPNSGMICCQIANGSMCLDGTALVFGLFVCQCLGNGKGELRGQPTRKKLQILGRFREIMNFRTMHSHSYVDPDSDCKQGDGCLFISVNILSSSQRLVVDLKVSPRIVIITISRKVASLCKSAARSSWNLPVCCVVGAPIWCG
jgi:hypothetical protein